LYYLLKKKGVIFAGILIRRWLLSGAMRVQAHGTALQGPGDTITAALLWDQIKAKLDDDEFLAREYRRAKGIMCKEQRGKALQTAQESDKIERA
jgi:hypothetical protein